MTEHVPHPTPHTDDPAAGLSATGRTADDFAPGDQAGSDYGDPGGVDTAEDEESTSEDSPQ